MCFSSWQLAKFTVWLEHKLMAAIPEVMLCDFFFCFQNRRGYRFFLSLSLFLYTVCLLYDFFSLKCPQCKKRLQSREIAAMKTFCCPRCGCQRF